MLQMGFLQAMEGGMRLLSCFTCIFPSPRSVRSVGKSPAAIHALVFAVFIAGLDCVPSNQATAFAVFEIDQISLVLLSLPAADAAFPAALP
jgi:hypothetical protein